MVESALRRVGKLHEVRRQVGEAGTGFLGAWPVARVVGGLYQDMAEVCVARPGDVAAAARLTAGMLTGNEPGVTHELARRGEPGEVARLSHDCDRGNEGDTPKRLEGDDEGEQLAVFGAPREAQSRGGGGGQHRTAWHPSSPRKPAVRLVSRK